MGKVETRLAQVRSLSKLDDVVGRILESTQLTPKLILNIVSDSIDWSLINLVTLFQKKNSIYLLEKLT